jgi:HEAT repeat protein
VVARALGELVAACDHPNPVVRFRAVCALGKTRDPRAFETILCLTDDPDERVRYDATLALGELGDMRAAEALLPIWLEDDVSRPAANAIATLGVKALPVVESALRHENARVRHSAVKVLGDSAVDHGDTRSIELLRRSLDDPDEYVRADAEFRLEEIREVRCPYEEAGTDDLIAPRVPIGE